MEKLFIVRKYVMAKDAATAIKKERSVPVNDVWVDEKWKDRNEITPPMKGFIKDKHA